MENRNTNDKIIIITFGLMSFISSYNNYMWPSLITDSPEMSLVSQGLRRYFIEGGAYGTEWPKVMAGSTIIVVPLLILFMFTQKWFINGIGGDTGMKDRKIYEIKENHGNRVNLYNDSICICRMWRSKKEETAKTEDGKVKIDFGIPEERLQLEFLEIWWKSLMLHRINMRSTA